MKSIVMLIVLMVGIGLFARKYDGWVRVLLIVAIGAVVLYDTFTA
jgi:hypothetical protein